MNNKYWVLDASAHVDDGLFCFCPIESDGTILTGMNILASVSPGPLSGVIHADGQEAAEEWMQQNAVLLERLQGRSST